MGQDHSRQEVRETYERIADGFAPTRRHPWPEVERFVEAEARRVDAGAAAGLDVGCGNGRHAELLGGCCARVLGVDISARLAELAKERARSKGWADGFVPMVGEATQLPCKPGTVELALYIATIHHLPDRRLRIRSLRELRAALSGSGTALVSAWSVQDDRFEARRTPQPRNRGFDTVLDWTLPTGETVGRYYHIYTLAELSEEVRRAGLTIIDEEVSSGNCYVTVGR